MIIIVQLTINPTGLRSSLELVNASCLWLPKRVNHSDSASMIVHDFGVERGFSLNQAAQYCCLIVTSKLYFDESTRTGEPRLSFLDNLVTNCTKFPYQWE